MAIRALVLGSVLLAADGAKSTPAEKDLQTAEFYRRTGNSGSAAFYYQLVQRRYTSSSEAATARQRLAELKR